MTLREIFNAIEGYTNDKEGLIKTLWETSRFEIMHHRGIHSKKGTNIKSKDIATFPWEQEIKPIGKEVIEEQIKRGKEVSSKWRKSIPKDVRENNS